ncbi:MAG: ammonium transporter [Propionicimonas sp.]|uniref:ammonium transporter n=1 Tax=Propionicimonas sp. TaxID=1955623 RepID=UPI002B2121DF|nr:ammonium transporter [Propionicimonas sp.]MEA4944688.1 ammonium transporter [Propionicimonas sp.]MEA5117989.1 ammonium transporter [Propionicimonas sp.]
MILELNSGDTAWVLTSASLVLLMTPGLALFYGGMVRAKSVLNMIMMSFLSIGIVGVLWVLYGYSMSSGTSIGGLIGNPLEYFGLNGIIGTPDDGVPTFAGVAFGSTFAIITVALISGAIADRVKFSTWAVFSIIWATLVYFPVAHWVWGDGGWIGSLGVIDFAGGTAIHINAGAAALVLALVVGPRLGFGTRPMRPHNMTLVMLGAALLWFGWFGFNAGSAGASDAIASLAWVNTLVAPAAAMLGWLVVEKLRDGHATSLGAASGIVAGLVGITPAAGSLSPLGSLVLGVVVGVACAYAVGLKYKFNYDDSLDVVGVHLVGGLVGTLLIGLLADPAIPDNAAGLFYGGGFTQLGLQAIGAFSAMAYSLVVTLIIALILKAAMGWRVSAADELGGIDLAEHSEVGYDLSPVYYSSKVQRTLVLSADDVPTNEKTGA